MQTVEFFRHCPGCGRQFHIKLEEKKMVSDEKRMIPTKRIALSPQGSLGTTSYFRGAGRGYIPPVPGAVLYEGKPIVLEEKEFQYTYKCGHCGHEWTEKRVEEHREK